MTLQEFETQAMKEIEAMESIEEIEPLYLSLLGKKGRLMARLKDLGRLKPEARKVCGEEIRQLHQRLFWEIHFKGLRLAASETTI